MTYEIYRARADEFMPQIEQILRKHAIQFISVRGATDKEDTKQATDMVVETSHRSWAVRVRFHPCNYRDLTIRSRARRGGKTELHKIREGHGAFYLYCWEGVEANGKGSFNIDEYIIVDLDKLRSSGLLSSSAEETINTDGKTAFVSLHIDALRSAGCLVNHETSFHYETSQLKREMDVLRGDRKGKGDEQSQRVSAQQLTLFGGIVFIIVTTILYL